MVELIFLSGSYEIKSLLTNIYVLMWVENMYFLITTVEERG